MTPKERLLAVLRGKEVDRLPWSPNVAYWWPMQSDEIISMGEVDFLESIGADPLIRGHYPMLDKEWKSLFLFKEEFIGCEKKEVIKGEKKLVTYTTPVGELNFEYSYSPAGDTWFLTRHGVSTEEDFKVLIYLKEHTRIIPDYSGYKEIVSRYGDRCLVLPLIVPEKKSAFQSLIEFWTGTEELVYALYDFPETVEEAIEVMRKVNLEAVKVSVESGAEAYITWEDSSTTNISPSWYEKYIAGEISDWVDIIHQNGGLYIQHACGKLKNLLPIMKNTGIDAIESISPPPTGDIELWDARQQLPENIALIGGIEPTMFENLRGDEFEKYVLNLVEKMRGTRFIIGNSDSSPPGVPLENYKAVAEILRKYGY